MKISSKEYIRHTSSKSRYLAINYQTRYGRGRIVVKESFFQCYLNRFKKSLKDVLITRIEEYGKGIIENEFL